jgi:DNA-binding winged helix-turn-helix (wHTH) protein/tetratricopeptide (TPR) repeat protein
MVESQRRGKIAVRSRSEAAPILPVALVESLAFGPFRLDLDNQCVRKDGREIALTPKAFAVLRLLVQRRGRLVPKQELLDAVWPDTVVVDAVLKVVVLEIRKALGETGRDRGFIETMHRRGYRLRNEQPGASASQASAAPPPGAAPPGASQAGAAQAGTAPPPAVEPLPLSLVGRQRELAELQQRLELSLAGRRQLVFVLGEAGAGKSSLLALFRRELLARPAAGLLVGIGQCNAMVGTGEPYMPVLEALARLCRGPSGPLLLQLLTRTAPTWLMQMPWLVTEETRGALERELRLASRERMVRELVEFVEALAAATPLVLVLEDLHWSDAATFGLLAALAARTEPARCLVVATTRPPDDAGAAPGLATLLVELTTSGRAAAIDLLPLSRADVAAVVAARAPDKVSLADSIYRRTGGHALFVAHLLDDLLAAPPGDRKATLRMPATLRRLLTAQLDRLPKHSRTLLQVAALSDNTFAVASVAAALDLDPLVAEAQCLELAHARLLVSLEPAHGPDGTVTARFRFAHELLREVAAEAVPPARTCDLHLRLGERLERGFAGHSDEAATELAFHFATALDRPRAVRYLRVAAQNASRRLAPAAAAEHLQHALALVDAELAGDHALQAQLHEELGNALRATGDMPGAARHYEQMAAAAVRSGVAEREVAAWLYVTSAQSWVDRHAAALAAAKAQALVPSLTNPIESTYVQGLLGYWHLLLEGYRPADETACRDAITALRAAGRHQLFAELAARQSFFLCFGSRYGEALATARDAQAICRENGNGFDYLLCAFFGAWAALHAGEWGEMLAILHDADAVAERNGHANLAALFRLQRGWLHEHAFDLPFARATSHRALAAARASGNRYGEMVGSVLLGYAHLSAGDAGAARSCFEEVEQLLAGRRVLMDWMWRLPLAHGVGECELLGGDLAAARRHAVAVLALARQVGDRQHLALGHRRLALVAEREGDLAGMAAELERAQRALDGGSVPLAAFRVHSTHARLWQLCSDRSKAEAALRVARATVDGLAASLARAERDPATAAEAAALRRSLLTADEVQKPPVGAEG